jgi:primase-polymerase (primpol)-like protein
MTKHDLETAREQPGVLSVNFENIPAELRELQQWDPWSYRHCNGSWRETLLQVNGSAASATLRDTWSTFERAAECYQSGDYDGLAFVLTEDDPYCVVTLNDVFVGDSNCLEAWAAAILATFSPCYAEISATGTGATILIRARKPGLPLLGDGKIEVYDREGFLAITGTLLDDSCSTINERQSQLDALYARWTGTLDLLNDVTTVQKATEALEVEPKISTPAVAVHESGPINTQPAAVLDKPQAVPVNKDAIPDDLKSTAHWVCWRFSFMKGKWTKVPYNPQSKRAASTTDPETWSTFDEVFSAYEKGRYDGIGFVVTKDNDHADPFVVVDLDHSVEDGQVKLWAQEIVNQLNTYTELSPSEKGLRLITRGRKPEGRCKAGDVEMYETRRYVSITGHWLETTPRTITDRQAEIDAVHARHLGRTAKKKTATSAPSNNGSTHNLSDTEVIDRAKAANPSFTKLWAGDASDYNSASEADAALCSHLAFWVGPDPARIDTLFRMSGLVREKWERQDYRLLTINLALRDKTEFYQPVEPLGRLKYTSGTTTTEKEKEEKEKDEADDESGTVEPNEPDDESGGATNGSDTTGPVIASSPTTISAANWRPASRRNSTG